MQKTLLFLFLLVCVEFSALPHALGQVTNQNARIQILGGTRVECLQSWDNQAAGTTDLTGTLDINGDLTNNGSFTGYTNSLLLFSGTIPQNVFGGSTVLTYDTEVNNAYNHVFLDNTLRITNQLLLTDGILAATDAAPVRFTPTAQDPAETNANRIAGTAIMEARAIGTAAMPTFLNLTLNAGSDLGNLTLTRRTGYGTISAQTGIVVINGNEAIACYWTIDPSVTGGTRTARFTWLPVLDNAKDLTQMQLWRTQFWGGETSPWSFLNYPPIPIPRDYTTTISNIRNSWTFSDITNPLPVTLSAFDGEVVPEGANLHWATASEQDFSHFHVLRSADGEQFEHIGQVQGRSQGQKEQNYSFLDEEFHSLESSPTYYRLRMYDTDGSSKLSPVIALWPTEAEVFALRAYPNPFSESLTLEFQQPEAQNAEITLFTASGKALMQWTVQQRRWKVALQEELQNLPSGAYYLRLKGQKEELLKLIKQ